MLTDQDVLWRTARPRLVRLAQLRGVPPDAIEDVVQETLLEALKHLHRLYAPDGFYAWIDEICRNICRRYARKRQLELVRSIPLTLGSYVNDDEYERDSPMIDIADQQGLDLSEALDQQDLETLLDRALGHLPPHAREVIELCYLAELPQREVAGRLGLTLSALEARLYRARTQLRQVLNGPLRYDAESFGLLLMPDVTANAHETRIWCTICGRHHLWGKVVTQSDGTTNVYLDCPRCAIQHGLHGVHDMEIVSLPVVRSFKPAWKRIMQRLSDYFMHGLEQGWLPCLKCSTPAPLRVLNIDQDGAFHLLRHLRRSPYRFWIEWRCPNCRSSKGSENVWLTVDDLVYWSDPQLQQFMAEHPRHINEPEQLMEYNGRAAIRLQMTDVPTAKSISAIVDHQNLRILDIRSAPL